MNKDSALRSFSALLIILLTVTVVLTDHSVQRRMAEDRRVSTVRLQVEKPAEVNDEKTYLLAGIGSEKSLFTNRVDGYTIEIPTGMTVDMKFSNIRAVLENDEQKIEIYRQKIDENNASGVESYINYSNLFMKNNIDHYREREGSVNLDGRMVSYLQWSRKPLEKIERDKCHYASVEVPLTDREVITFLFKSSRKFENQSYLDLVESLELIDQTAEPHREKIKKTENKSWNEKTAEVYEDYFGDSAGLQWGIFETDAPVDFTELKKIESKVDFTFPILLYYTGILENREVHPHLTAALHNAKLEGRILELTLQSVEQTPGKGNMVYDVLDGEYDTYLRNYAREVVASGEPVLFRLGNEMNGDWCVYSSHHTSKDTDIFQEFYRYVYEIFRNEGADNVIWVWNPNGKSFPDFKWNDELCYYPGDEYVDVIGMTGYNTGTYYESETWMEFDELYESLYQNYIDLYEKPLMITEFSSGSVGGSKEAWVADMFQNIEKYKRIKVAIWWDGCDWDSEGNVARSYFIDETEELVRLFRENLARSKP